MDMIVVTPPRTDFPQPVAVAFRVFAHLHFGTGEDEDPCHPLVRRGSLQQRMMLFGPLVIDEGTFGPPHGDRADILALLTGQVQPICRAQPDIDVQPRLMAAMTCQHGTAARLAHVANIDPVPPLQLRDFLRQVADIVQRLGVRPVAVPAQAHGLPGWASLCQLLGPGDTAIGIAAKGFRLVGGACLLGPEKLFGKGRCVGSPDEYQEGCRSGDEVSDHARGSPSGLTHASKIRPKRNSPMRGETPICCDPLR